MADRSKIEWTDASWNPVTGCSKVSPGCAHCYARSGGSEATASFDDTERRRVADLFASDVLVYRVLTDRTALSAADIGNTYPSLTPGDCVHIATAIEARADVLFTYDGAGQRRRPNEMLRYDTMIGTPPLRIMEPFDPWPALGLEFADTATSKPSPLQLNPPALANE